MIISIFQYFDCFFETALKIDKSFWYSSSGLIQAKRSGYTLYNKAFYLANSSLYIKEEDKKLAQLNKALSLFKQSREEITEKDWKWVEKRAGNGFMTSQNMRLF